MSTSLQSTRNEATGSNKNSIKAAAEKLNLQIDEDTIRKYVQESCAVVSALSS